MNKCVLLLAIALGGCQTITTALGTTVSPQAALVAANSFDVLEAAATTYLSLPPCTSTQTVACRSSSAVANIVPAVRAGRTARNQIESLLSANNGAAIPVASYNTLEATITTLQSVYTQFGIQTASK